MKVFAVVSLLALALAGCNAIRAGFDPKAPPEVIKMGQDEMREAGQALAAVGAALSVFGGPVGATFGGIFAMLSGGFYAAGRAIGRRAGNDEIVMGIAQTGVVKGEVRDQMASLMPPKISARVKSSKARLRARGEIQPSSHT
jgi:hypothetical protein